MGSLHMGLVRLSALCFAAASTTGADAAQIYPSGPSVPENLLRLEVRLDQPLDRAPDEAAFSLRRGCCEVLEDALLQQPLLSRDGRWVTLYMHPGRVKSGLVAHDRAGRAVTAGQSLRLTVAADVAGKTVTREWQVEVAVSTPIDVGSWRIKAPSSRSRVGVMVRMDRPIGARSAGLLAVTDGRGRALRGHASLMPGEQVWRFVPESAWAPGGYFVVVHPGVEDVAGNRACSSFEARNLRAAECGHGRQVPFVVR
jgi:hypothetical protein